MITLKPFRGLRPAPELARDIASPPYDVLDKQEARAMVRNNPNSFLHIIRPDIDMDDAIDPYDPRVYDKGADNLQRLITERAMIRDPQPCYYIYRMRMAEHVQVGLVAAASVDDYLDERIKEHESTRPDKEQDRVNHIDRLNAHTGPVFLMYKDDPAISALIADGMQQEPVYDFIGDHDVQNTLYLVNNADLIEKLRRAFSGVEALYVADGHHRAAAAARVREMRRKDNPAHTGEEEYNTFLSVVFPDTQMKILEYNRAICDINGHSDAAYLEGITERFELSKHVSGNGVCKPDRQHTFGMYYRDNWYQLKAKPAIITHDDPIAALDVAILHENLLAPLLNIGDPRTDQRIRFIGGIRGLGELERVVKTGKCDVAFAMYPTSIAQLMSVADAGKMMPPKSTWFEPKLESGLVVHLLD
jgi:uncharacterized protein (DUF1015 family)